MILTMSLELVRDGNDVADMYTSVRLSQDKALPIVFALSVGVHTHSYV
jgi:hypothetical protein